MAAAKKKAEKPADAPVLGTTASAGVIDRWGPFEENTYVTNQHGEYTVQAGHILMFEMVDKLNKNTLEMEKVAKPVRRKATAEELELYGVTLEKQKPNKQLMEQSRKKSAPMLMEISINGGAEGETFPGVMKRAPVAEDH